MSHGQTSRPGAGGRVHRGNALTNEKGQPMDEVLKGQMPADPDARIEARRSDAPADRLPPDAQDARRRQENA